MGCWSYDKHPKENLFAYNVNSTTMYVRGVHHVIYLYLSIFIHWKKDDIWSDKSLILHITLIILLKILG